MGVFGNEFKPASNRVLRGCPPNPHQPAASKTPFPFDPPLARASSLQPKDGSRGYELLAANFRLARPVSDATWASLPSSVAPK